MKKLPQNIYAINSITCFFIGAMHTIVHYNELVTEQIKMQLDQELVVNGIHTSFWDMWQGMSLMMGILLIVVGLTNLLIVHRLDKGEQPPVLGSVIFIGLFAMVTYTGLQFFGAFQLYGGMYGIASQMLCLVLTILYNRRE